MAWFPLFLGFFAACAANQGGYAPQSLGTGGTVTGGSAPPSSVTAGPAPSGTNSAGGAGVVGSPNSTTTTPGGATHPANPFEGATLYVNPDWSAEALSSVGTAAPADAALLQKVKSTPTGVWLDSIETLAGTPAQNGNPAKLSFIAHLDHAVAQAAADNKPAVAVFVVYNLPNRDCAAGASAGKLQGTAGLATYKTNFIDVIAAGLAMPVYKDLRVVLILEPDSLPNMVTNTNLDACKAVAAQNLYAQGVSYAISKLALPNTTLYLDIAQAAWLGWPSNMSMAVDYYKKLINTATNNTPSMVRGFTTNISNYIPLQETGVSPSNMATLQGSFYQSNPIFDELSYVKALASQFDAAGLPGMHFITDTSRNGWASTPAGQPIDQRPLRSDWCNVKTAGLGERPRASPALWDRYDAFLWVKPPGESDGASGASDASCNPANASLATMDGAPAAGVWFPAGMLSLCQHATPPL